MKIPQPILALIAKVRPYAKAIVAVAGFVGVLAEQIAANRLDSHSLIVAGTAALTALGVYGTRNAAV